MVRNRLPQVRALALGSAFALCCVAAAAAPPQVAPLCVAQGKNARITWSGTSAAGARLYFRSDNAKTEHYIDMRRAPGRFAAVLPKPESAVTIAYRVATPQRDGRYLTRLSGTLTVREGCPAADLTTDESVSASALVLGLAEEGPSLPVGFGCEGIIGRISPSGELSAFDACAAEATAALGIRRNSFPSRPAVTEKLQPAGDALGVGVITPDHHRLPRRAPIPPTPPNPRVVEPVSQSRP